ncbi:MAG: NUDIX hydrolase [Bacteroidales bacterium]|jgi:ADP-ribose pyrophosphatase
MNWKILSSRYLFNRPWLTVRCESLEIPGGHVIPEYYVLEYPEWINITAITPEGEFIFVKQYRRGLDVDSLELCAGVCDPGETPLEAAKRELLEETGYGMGEWSLIMTISANPGTHNNLTYCYLARNVYPVAPPHPEETEDLSVHLLSENQVLDLLKNDELKQALHVAPLWKYFAYICLSYK